MSTLNVSNITDGTTTVGTEYVVNGSAKAWVNFNGTGTIAVRDSVNVASLTDNGTGDYTVSISSAFGSNGYSIVTSSTWHSGVSGSTNTTVNGDSGGPTSSSFGFVTYRTPDDVRFDPEFCYATNHGDLA